jgi:antitoxin component of MazEF toxin-antitoxin module
MEATYKLVKIGAGLAVILPDGLSARSCGFKPGSYVRMIMLKNEIRVRPVSTPREYDLETMEEYRERQARAQLPGRWD